MELRFRFSVLFVFHVHFFWTPWIWNEFFRIVIYFSLYSRFLRLIFALKPLRSIGSTDSYLLCRFVSLLLFRRGKLLSRFHVTWILLKTINLNTNHFVCCLHLEVLDPEFLSKLFCRFEFVMNVGWVLGQVNFIWYSILRLFWDRELNYCDSFFNG